MIFLRLFFWIYRFDVDGSTFSPPPHEDQFFYIRYPNAENKKDTQSDVKSLTEAIQDLNTKPTTTTSTASLSSTIQHGFSKQHTDSCKKYLNYVEKGEFLFRFFCKFVNQLVVGCNISYHLVLFWCRLEKSLLFTNF